MTLAPPDGESVVSLLVGWSRDAESVPLSQLVSAEAFFPNARKVQTAGELDVTYESAGLWGEANFAEPVRWWRRPFHRNDWRRWRLWAIRRGPVLLMAILVNAPEPDLEREALVTLMLRTVVFSHPPADPPRVFTDRVLELSRSRFPLLTCEAEEDFQLRLGESQVNLFNFYRSYVAAPERFEEIMLPALTTVVQVQGWGPEQSDPALEAVRTRILPMLYPAHVWEERFPSFVGQPWVGGLAVLYVVDESRAYWYIRAELLQRWSLTCDELHELALGNLDAYFEQHPMELTVAQGDDGPTLMMPARADSYNAARFLSPSFRDKVADLLGATFAVGLPGRDFFVAVGLTSGEVVEHVRVRVQDDFAQVDHPLSERLLLVSPDGVSEFAET